MHFDIRTLYIVFTFVFAICAVVLFISWRIHRVHFPEIRYYFLCLSTYTISIFLQSLDGIAPDFLSGFLGFLLTLVAPFYLYRGLCISDSRPFMDNINIALILLALPPLIYYALIENNLVVRAVTFSLFSPAIMIRIFNLVRKHREGSVLARRLLMTATILHIISALAILPIAALTLKNNDLMAPNLYLGIDLVVLFGVAVLLTLGLVILYSSKLQNMERKLADERGRLLEEKSMLLREMNHRTKNNLSIINGLLLMKSSSLNDSDAVAALEESSARVVSMGVLYDLLHKEGSLNTVNIGKYIADMVKELGESLAPSSVGLICDIGDSIPEMGMDYAVPLGLIVNELVTNSIKYAFPNGENGEIYVGLKRTERGEYELTVRDNGVGISEDIDIDESTSLGMAVVRNYAQQINGTLHVKKENGVSTSIRFNN